MEYLSQREHDELIGADRFARLKLQNGSVNPDFGSTGPDSGSTSPLTEKTEEIEEIEKESARQCNDSVIQNGNINPDSGTRPDSGGASPDFGPTNPISTIENDVVQRAEAKRVLGALATSFLTRKFRKFGRANGRTGSTRRYR